MVASGVDLLVSPQRAIFAVIGADIGNQSLEKNARAAVGQRYGIDPSVFRTAHPMIFIPCAARTRQIVLGIGAEYFQFSLCVRPADYGGHGFFLTILFNVRCRMKVYALILFQCSHKNTINRAWKNVLVA
jgi:hypothetical protein